MYFHTPKDKTTVKNIWKFGCFNPLQVTIEQASICVSAKFTGGSDEGWIDHRQVQVQHETEVNM